MKEEAQYKFVWRSFDITPLRNVKPKRAYAFCPTGEGGGIDNSCSPSGEPGGGDNNGWFHGTHEEKLNKLIARPVESIDTFGTWVTSSSEYAGMLYGPNVLKANIDAKNLLTSHTDSFDDFFFSNKNFFKSLFPNEPLSTLGQFKAKGVLKNEPEVWEKRKVYLAAFRKMLQEAGHDGVIWKNSRIDLRKSDASHDVAVIFNTNPIALSSVKDVKLPQKQKKFPGGFFDDYPDGPPGLFKPNKFDRQNYASSFRLAIKRAYARASNGGGYKLALMGFDFADARQLQDARAKFKAYLLERGAAICQVDNDVDKLNHAWDFAAYAFCPTGEGGGIDNSCSPTGEDAENKNIESSGFWHGTSISRLEGIIKDGIKAGLFNNFPGPRGSMGKDVFVSANKQTAVLFGIVVAKDLGETQFALLRIRVPPGVVVGQDPELTGDVLGSKTIKEIKKEWIVGGEIYEIDKEKSINEIIRGKRLVRKFDDTEVIYVPLALEAARNIRQDFDFYFTSKGDYAQSFCPSIAHLGKSFFQSSLHDFKGALDLTPGSTGLKLFDKYKELAFCPTGEGGGIDNSCSPSGGDNISAQRVAVTKDTRSLAQIKTDLATRWDVVINVEVGVDEKRAAKVGAVIESVLSSMAEDSDWVNNVIKGGSATASYSGGLTIELRKGKSIFNETHKSQAAAWYNLSQHKLVIASGLTITSSSALKLGEFSISSGMDDTIAHEIGHAITSQIAKRAVEAGQLSLAELYASKPKSYWQKHISFYAGTSRRELLAEAVAAYTSPHYATAKKKLPVEIEVYLGSAGLASGKRKVLYSIGKSFFQSQLPGFKGALDLTPGSTGLKLFDKYKELAFCPTGEGGGIDPTCSPRTTTTGAGEELRGAVRDAATKKLKDLSGKPVPDHINKLAIPPAWKDVYFNPDKNGDLLVKGTDVKGRTQVVYSATHHAQAAAAKFGRVTELRQKRGEIFKELEADIKNPELREKAEVLSLIMQTGIRPGSEQDTGADFKSFGATTLQGRHVVVKGDKTSLRFVAGKSHGKNVVFSISDPATASMLRDRAAKAGSRGKLFSVSAGELREYSMSKDGGGFKTKDHRTALGTETAIREVQARRTAPKTLKEYKQAVKAVATMVAKTLGNTPAIALKSYIDPVVFSKWKVT